MKPPSKTKRMKKYMILFSVVLLFVVLSTVLAGYVGTKKVVEDIPSIVEKQVEKLPGVESLKISLSNISDNQDDFNQGIAYTCNQVTIIFVNVCYLFLYLSSPDPWTKFYKTLSKKPFVAKWNNIYIRRNGGYNIFYPSVSRSVRPSCFFLVSANPLQPPNRSS